MPHRFIRREHSFQMIMIFIELIVYLIRKMLLFIWTLLFFIYFWRILILLRYDFIFTLINGLLWRKAGVLVRVFDVLLQEKVPVLDKIKILLLLNFTLLRVLWKVVPAHIRCIARCRISYVIILRWFRLLVIFLETFLNVLRVSPAEMLGFCFLFLEGSGLWFTCEV